MTNIKDLLENYADTCEAIGGCKLGINFAVDVPESVLASVRSIEKRKANLESQIIKLFEEAKSEGAQVEREECIKIAEQWRGTDGISCSHRLDIARAIRERGNQSDEGKVGE